MTSSTVPPFDGPLRVLAGPGTGKTQALVDIYAGLVLEGRAGRSQILVLTFSTGAADEIARRLDRRLEDSYDRAWISTFHGFCARLLREHRPDPERVLLNGFQEFVAMRTTLRGLDAADLGPLAPLRGHDSFVQDVLAFVALLKQNLVGPQHFVLRAQTSGGERMRALAAIYASYQRRLDEAGLYDFRDLVSGTIDLLDSRPALLERLREGFRYVLVDEFQDVDPAQFELVQKLAPPERRPRLAVLGDPDQAIYGFRGTVPGLLRAELPRLYELQSRELDLSWRCPEPVLEAAERLLGATQPGRAPRRLRAARPAAGPALSVLREGNAVDEAFAVAREIRRRVVDEGRRPGEFAVLLRSTTTLSAPFEEAIRALDLPYEVRGLGALARNEVVRFVLSYLRSLAAPDAPDALERVLGSGLSGVAAHTVGRLRRHALEEARPFRKVVHRVLYRMAARDPERWPLPWGGEAPTGEEGRDPDFMAFLQDPELDSLHAALRAWDGLRRRAAELPVSALAYAVLAEAGVLRRLLEQDLPEAVRADALGDLRATCAGLADLEAVTERLTGEKPTVAALGPRLESLVARAVDDAQPADRRHPDAVQVLTVHQSKGLEFPFVFLAGFAHGVFPLPLRAHPLLDADDQAWLETLPGFRASWPHDPEEQVAEEARLAYVGMTRAQEHLYLTFADEYDGPAGASPFLELAAPAAPVTEHARAGTAPEPASILTLSEAETVLAALAPALTDADVEALAALGADAGFVLAPGSGQPFEPYHRPAHDVDPGHFSATAINDYLKCPRIYWYGQHPGLAAPVRSVEMERGSFLHEVLEEFHAREGEWRQLPADAQRGWLEATLEAHLQEYLARVEGVLERRAEEQEVRRILDNYIRFATTAQPIRRLGTLALEKKFFLQVEGSEIRGKIDRIIDTGAGTCEVVDYKTGRGGAATKKYGEYFGPEMHDVQLALYYLACRDGVGEDGERIELEPRWLSLWYPKEWRYGSMRQVLFAVGDPAPGVRDWVQKPLEPADLERSREVVVGAIRGIRAGDFAPRPRDVVGTCLSFFGCPHAAICPYGGQPVD